MKNPWLDLPKIRPYILSQDLQLFRKFKLRPEGLGVSLEVLPVPYIGNLDYAKVVLLCLNPGFKEEDAIKPQDDFEENCKALTFSSVIPFYCLNPSWEDNGGYLWWSKILKHLITAKGLSTIQKQVMCIQYFPYHSKKFNKIPFILPSQNFSFSLVKDAIKRNKVIVIMRSKKLWIEAVPEFENYPYIELKNYRRPFISKRNMKEGDFERVISALQE